MNLSQPITKSIVNFKDPVWFRHQFKIIMREWADHLTLQQIALVMFIFDRTAAWGKEWELIKTRAFVEGITNADGDKRYAVGVCNSMSTAERLTGELLEMGIARKRRSREGNIWSLNYNWTPHDMKEPRIIKRNPSPMTGSNPLPMKGSNPSCMKGHKYSEAIEENASQNITLSRPSGRETSSSPSIQEALAKAKAKTAAALERKAVRKQGRMNSSEVARHWAEAVRTAPWLEVAGEAANCYLTKRDAQAMKSYSDRFAKSYPKESFRDFLTWTIHNWMGVRTEVFGWMTKCPAPESPASLFIIKWADRVVEKYLQRVAFEKRLEMTPEQREVGRLVKSGMSLEKAKEKAYGKEAKSFGGAIRRRYQGEEPQERPMVKTTPITPRSRSFPNRNSNRSNIALPSLGDTDRHNSYED